MAQTVKHLPAVQETWVRYLGWEDPLEKEMATHSSTLAWKIPWTEEPGRLLSMGSQRVRHDWATSLHFTSLMIQINFFITTGTSVKTFVDESELFAKLLHCPLHCNKIIHLCKVLNKRNKNESNYSILHSETVQ